MQYMIIRRADQQSESAPLAPSESALLFAALKPSQSGVRLSLRNGEATVSRGPFGDPAEMIAGFTIVDVPDKEGAVEWLRRWPQSEQPVELEIRESGCPGGCDQVMAAESANPQGKRFAVLLRMSRALEDEDPVPEHKLAALLRKPSAASSTRGARVKVARGSFSVVDGPFTEIKEMIAGFWMIRAASMDEAIAWATRNPYPTGPEVDVEIRELFDAADAIDAFTPDLQSAEQRMRAEQLEAGMRAHFTA